VAGLLAYESRALLLGESVAPEILQSLRELALSEPGVEDAGPPLTMHFGPDRVLLNMEIRFQPDLPARDLVGTIERFEEKVRQQFPVIERIFIAAGSLRNPSGLGRLSSES
jgi:divalent metal cation (Fe/Co/Zn/Cd) transporter